MTTTHTPAGARTDLDNLLDDLTGFTWLPGITQILDGIRTTARAAATGHLDLDATQTLFAVLTGAADGTDLVGALAELTAQIATPDTNPALTHLDPHAQKRVQQHGEQARYALLEPDLHAPAAEASAAISSY